MSELPDNIEKLGPALAILRGLIHFEILSLKILGKLLRSCGWSDVQTFGIKMKFRRAPSSDRINLIFTRRT